MKKTIAAITYTLLLLICSSSHSSSYGEDTKIGELSYSQQSFQIPIETENIILVDMSGNGLADIIANMGKVIRIYFQQENGFDFDAGFSDIQFPGEAVGWDISSENGMTSILALIDGKEVLQWSTENGKIQQAISVKSDLNGFIGKGANRLHFSQDVNDDGLKDLIIPGAGQLNLYIGQQDKSYQDSITIQSEVRIQSNLNSNQLERRTGQAIRIPRMDLRDVNGDGSRDLISRSEESLDVFLADKLADNYFPRQPSYTLNIEEIEQRLGGFDIDNLDFSNLTGVLALTHEEILEDVDGDNIDDLLLREGGKISLFGGTETGMNFEQPRQVLRSGGNVLSTFLYDENEDGLKDLWLWRVEPISVGDIFLWLALSGSISVEAFVYPNEGERFSRRPARKLTVELKFPSVIRLATSVQEITEQARSVDAPLSAQANLGSNLEREDLLFLLNTQLEIFLNSIETNDSEDTFLSSLSYSRQRDDYEINIREILDSASSGSHPHLDAIAGRQADITISLDVKPLAGDIIPVKLNSDEYDDVFVFTQQDSGQIQGLLLLSNEN